DDDRRGSAGRGLRIPADAGSAPGGGVGDGRRPAEGLLQAPQGLERGVHLDESFDQSLGLLCRPADLLSTDRVERPAELLVGGDQLADVAHAVLRQPAPQLAVVAGQLLGVTSDVDRHVILPRPRRASPRPRPQVDPRVLDDSFVLTAQAREVYMSFFGEATTAGERLGGTRGPAAGAARCASPRTVHRPAAWAPVGSLGPRGAGGTPRPGGDPPPGGGGSRRRRGR